MNQVLAYSNRIDLGILGRRSRRTLIDLTDYAPFSGRVAYFDLSIECDEWNSLESGTRALLTNRQISSDESKNGSITIRMGPFCLDAWPRGVRSNLFKLSENIYFDSESNFPESKQSNAHTRVASECDWSNIDGWSRVAGVGFDVLTEPVDSHEEVRHLETRILLPPVSALAKVRIFAALCAGSELSDYFDFSNVIEYHAMRHLINTYVSRDEALELCRVHLPR